MSFLIQELAHFLIEWIPVSSPKVLFANPKHTAKLVSIFKNIPFLGEFCCYFWFKITTNIRKHLKDESFLKGETTFALSVCLGYQTKYLGYTLHTLPPKTLHTFSSLWSKTTLNTGRVGGAETDPQTWKMETSFLISLVLCMSIFNNFSLLL